LPSNGYSSFHFTQHMLLHYLGKLKHDVKMNKERQKPFVTLLIGTWRRITWFFL